VQVEALSSAVADAERGELSVVVVGRNVDFSELGVELVATLLQNLLDALGTAARHIADLFGARLGQRVKETVARATVWTTEVKRVALPFDILCEYI
jgi:hypothetical protein